VHAFRVAGADASLYYHDLPALRHLPAIVFLHGLGGAASEAFPPLARHPRLARSRALLVDFLGFGYSEAPADFGYTMEEHADSVAALLDHLGLRGVHLVGHSMGGTVAIALAARHPHLVGRLVVAEGNLDPGKGGASVRIAAQSEQEYVEQGHARLVRELQAASGGQASYGGLLRGFTLAAPYAIHRGARSLLVERRPTFRQLLEALRIPRTYIVGQRSLPNPPEGPPPGGGVKLAVVPDAGHIMYLDNLDGFAAAIADALGGS
jgi:pimeloyl-ACP methyl ester carboxylesterase